MRRYRLLKEDWPAYRAVLHETWRCTRHMLLTLLRG